MRTTKAKPSTTPAALAYWTSKYRTAVREPRNPLRVWRTERTGSVLPFRKNERIMAKAARVLANRFKFTPEQITALV